MRRAIIGLNAYHGDSSACLVIDGELVAAAEEERFRRVKHWAGFPDQAIKYCLSEGGINLDQVSRVAVNSSSRAHLGRKVAYALLGPAPFSQILDRLRNRKKRDSVRSEFMQSFPGTELTAEIVPIEHHLSHLASAYYCSPFEEAVVVSVDGFGDFASAAWAIGRSGKLELLGRIFFPHSLGVFYQAMTQFLGFPNYGDEYKVMGLAPYGEPEFLPEMRRVVRSKPDGAFELDLRYFRHHREKIAYAWSGGEPSVGTLFSPSLETLLGPCRHRDDALEDRHRNLASSIQVRYEEAFFDLLNSLHRRCPIDAVAVAGGCGMNSVANGKIRRKTPFRQSYIQAAAGDAGGAIGAAFEASRESNAPIQHNRMRHAYLGPGFSNEQIRKTLDVNALELAEECSVESIWDFSQLAERTAKAIADGKVVGWFQGRMEWGPRALGNRSILGDPRRADMKDILNQKIKRRESFRPFAPSILREHVSEWFEEDDDVPFMMKVFQIRKERRETIPAVTHVDGSGRLQTVYRQTNRRYYELIKAFSNLTSVPMVLNTSFNENEPVVCQPSEALACFMRTKMDVLVLNDFYIARDSEPT